MIGQAVAAYHCRRPAAEWSQDTIMHRLILVQPETDGAKTKTGGNYAACFLEFWITDSWKRNRSLPER